MLYLQFLKSQLNSFFLIGTEEAAEAAETADQSAAQDSPGEIQGVEVETLVEDTTAVVEAPRDLSSSQTSAFEPRASRAQCAPEIRSSSAPLRLMLRFSPKVIFKRIFIEIKQIRRKKKKLNLRKRCKFRSRVVFRDFDLSCRLCLHHSINLIISNKIYINYIKYTQLIRHLRLNRLSCA